MKIAVFWFKLHGNVLPMAQLTISNQLMAWRQIGDKPLPESMLAKCADAYMCHSSSMSWMNDFYSWCIHVLWRLQCYSGMGWDTYPSIPGWHHQMETLLALYEGNPLVTGGFPSQKPSDAELWCFFDLHLNKWLSKHLHAHYDVIVMSVTHLYFWDHFIIAWCHGLAVQCWAII